MLTTEGLHHGGRRVPGFGLSAPNNWANLILSQCCTVSFQVSGSTGATAPYFNPAYWRNVQGFAGNYTATWIGGTQSMPTTFPDAAPASNATWSVTSYNVTAPPLGATWNGQGCVSIVLHGPAPHTTAPAPVNTATPITSGVFTFVSGHRYKSTVTSTTPLSQLTAAQLTAYIHAVQTIVPPAGGTMTPVAVPSSNCPVDPVTSQPFGSGNGVCTATSIATQADYKGPTWTLTMPTFPPGWSLALQDMGPSPGASSSSSSSSSTATTVAYVAGGLALAGGALWLLVK